MSRNLNPWVSYFYHTEVTPEFSLSRKFGAQQHCMREALFVKLGVVSVNNSRHAEFVVPEFVGSFVVFAEIVTRKNFGARQRANYQTDQTD